MLLPLLPAGLGPRDAVLVVGLAGVTGAAAAASLALALRVVSFASELVAVAIAEAASFVLGRRERSAARPVTRGGAAYSVYDGAGRTTPSDPRTTSSSRPTTSASRCRCSSSASKPRACSC